MSFTPPTWSNTFGADHIPSPIAGLPSSDTIVRCRTSSGTSAIKAIKERTYLIQLTLPSEPNMSTLDVELHIYSNATTCFKSIIVACTTLHLYYTVTHFDEEVEYIWSRKWTFGKIMYLLTRYLGTVFLICSVIGVSAYTWNDSGYYTSYSVESEDEPPTLQNFIPTCLHGELFAGLGPMIILVAEVIHQMRVYALYGREKRLLAFFILLTICLSGFNVLQMSGLFSGFERGACSVGDCLTKRSISRRTFIPYTPLNRDTCLSTVPISGIGWSVIAFTEFLLFFLVIIRAWKRLFGSREQAIAHDLRALMAKDSLSYFAVLFIVCLFGAIIQFVPERIFSYFAGVLSSQGNSYVTFAITVMTILAPRLIINLREEFYGPPEITESQLSWNADVLGHLSSDDTVDYSTDADAAQRS